MNSIELERPRPMLVLPECDLFIVLEALVKPPYEPLWEASLKHITYETFFVQDLPRLTILDIYTSRPYREG